MVECGEQVFLCTEPTTKGKRTKRQRTPPHLPISVACSSSTTVLQNSGHHGSSGREEEEDMANCLMLLAQGHGSSSSSSEAPRGNVVGEESYSYRCKTCNRSFPSFQALGGHCASHRKPKAEEGRRVDQIVNPNTTLTLQIPTRVLHGGGKSKLHECAICGAEFTSGQALGGHMRRHRTVTSASPVTTVSATSINFERRELKKPKSGLGLDLNLPAPENVRESSLSTHSKQQVIVFSALPC